MNGEPLPVEIKQPSVPLPVKEVPKTLQEWIFKWLSEQGVPTVILAAIGAGLWFGIPKYTEAQNAAKLREFNILMNSHDRDREVFREAIRELSRP